MEYLDQEIIKCVEEIICKKLFSKFGLKSDCFLFDPTNFLTYIRNYKKNTIAQRGHNKKKQNESISEAILKLDEFVKIWLNTKPQWKDPKKVALKIDRDILKTKKLRAIIVFSIEKINNGLELTWEIDIAAQEEYLKNLGKSIIFSNRNEWSILEIVKTYRAQIKVE